MYHCSSNFQPPFLHPETPIWGDFNKMVEGERTVPPPSPSWAEMVRRGIHPQSRSTLPPPPAPAGHHPSHPFAHLLNLYRGCVAEGRWARFTLETRCGEEEFSFTCSGRPAAAAAGPIPAAPTTRRHVRKRPPNQRRREKERRRQEVRKEKRTADHAAALSEAAGAAAALPAAAVPTAPVPTAPAVPAAAVQEADVPAATVTAAGSNPAADVRVAAIPTAAAQDAAVPSTAIPQAAVAVAAIPTAVTVPAAAAAATAAAVLSAASTVALRERTKAAAGERRASARSSVLAKRRDVNEMGPPETLRGPEMEVPELELSLDLGERDFVFSPPPGEVEVAGQEAEPGSLVKEKHKERVPISLSDEERRERDLEMEKIADRLVATLTAACSKKKKRKH